MSQSVEGKPLSGDQAFFRKPQMSDWAALAIDVAIDAVNQLYE